MKVFQAIFRNRGQFAVKPGSKIKFTDGLQVKIEKVKKKLKKSVRYFFLKLEICVLPYFEILFHFVPF